MMKTAEQAAKRYADTQCMDGTAYKAFLAGVKWAERWIPVEDELPENSMRVIVCTQLPNGARLITGGWYGREPGEMGWNVDIDNWPGLEVVGWRPIEHK